MARFEELSVQELTIPEVTSVNAGSVVALTLTPVAVVAATTAKQTFTVAGLLTTDKVVQLSDPITNAVALTGAEVSAANTLRLAFVNPTAGSLTPTTGTYSFLVIRGA